MADFCSLCEYADIDVKKIYDTHLKPTLAEDIKILQDDEFSTCGVGGVCESCGLISIGVNNKLELWGGYYKSEPHKFGYVDKNTLDIRILENDAKYDKQRERMKLEKETLKREFKVLEDYCAYHNKTTAEFSSEDWVKVNLILSNKTN